MGSSQGPDREAPVLEVRPGFALWQGPGACVSPGLGRHPMHVPTNAVGKPRIDAPVDAADEAPPPPPRDDVGNRENRFGLRRVSHFKFA